MDPKTPMSSNTESQEQATERSLAIRQAAQIMTGERGLRLTNYEEMYRFAKAVAQSKFKPVPDWTDVDCFICLQKGAEVGMTPMQSLESIYIVNNRATLFGDAPKGLIEASGLMIDYDQYEEGKPFDDDYKYVVSSHRKGRSKPLITTYSVADAKLAKLWGKAGAWTTAPKRMLMFRARGFNLRDNFADVLKGFTIGELLDEESVAGFEHAKSASAKVVEPSFDQPAPAAVAVQTDVEPPKRPRGRPPKTQPSEPVTAPTPEPVAAAPEQPPDSLFSEQAESSLTLLDEATRPIQDVLRRLKSAGISEETFLNMLVGWGYLECDKADIAMGNVTIANIQPQDIERIRTNWPQVIDQLRSMPE